MKIKGQDFRTISYDEKDQTVIIIDQSVLPHQFLLKKIDGLEQAEQAIREMWVRGAPLIGVTAAYGLALQMKKEASDKALEEGYHLLLASRPTAINLKWALDHLLKSLSPLAPHLRQKKAFELAHQMAEEDVRINQKIGEYGVVLLQKLWHKKQREGAKRLNILTHCNAGWLATVDWGTALAPLYKADEFGIPLHVWVDETRPRNQGAALTACELNWAGLDHTVIADNTGGHLMQQGHVDCVFVGTDRTTRQGDVCNKIGTYLKALAAFDCNIPFYVCVPSSSIDWTISNGLTEIPIEERSAREVTHITGKTDQDLSVTVQLTPSGSKAINYGFDVTPARLITGLITERGICEANLSDLLSLFPERRE